VLVGTLNTAVAGNKMITTEFLSIQDYPKFGDWLRIQDEETRQLYFGVSGSDHVIQALMDRVVGNPDDHYILVAQNGTEWAGTIHIAVSNRVVEFGIIVRPEYRGQGVANTMLEEAIVWARNRGYKELFMHCLGWNKPIQHLCRKHGLETKNMYGDSEVEVKLPPGNWATLSREFAIKQHNMYHTFLQKNWALYQELYG
jgi:RimJ/RimL family protein N-acetyltransferase